MKTEYNFMKYFYTLLIVFLSVFSSNAQKYWVNGSGNWNDTSHWSTISGGEGGASIPTLHDEIIFDDNSFSTKSKIVTIKGAVYLKKITNLTNFSIEGTPVLISSERIKTKHIDIVRNTKFEHEDPSSVNASFSISVSSTDETCSGDCDGTITVDIASGSPTYPVEIRLTYPDNLQPPEYVFYSNLTAADFPYTIDSLCGDGQSYNARVEDSDGTKKSKNIRVLIPDAIIVDDANTDDATCNGKCDGKAEILDVSGGTGDLHHLWSNGVTEQDYIDGLCKGDYTDTIRDDNDCFITYDFTVSEPDGITVDDANYTEYICGGGSNGEIHVTASGGTGSLAYDIGGTAQDNGNFTGLASGDYTVHIEDDNGCFVDTSFTLKDNSVISISETHEDVKCKGGSDGSIDVTVTGGTTDYTFIWNGPDGYTDTIKGTDGDISGLKPGTYDLDLTDDVGCTESLSVTIGEPANALSISETHEDVKCKGESNGSIDLSVTGGTSPYKYDWDTDGTGDDDDTEDLTGLSAGTYKVTVTDKNGCSENLSVTIGEPTEALSISETHEDVKCKGESNGSIDLSVTGGTSPYKYDWDTDGTGDDDDTEDLTGLSAGTYKVTVTDKNGCSKNLSVTISEPSTALSISETHEDVKCKGESNGSIDLSVTGGTSPYKYDWDTDGTGDDDDTEDLTGLSVGTYKVTVTDKNGCSESLSVTISEPSTALSISETHEDVKCKGESNGSIDLSVTGGTSPYKYDWDTDGTGDDDDTEDLTGLSAGTYKVTVTDKNGCSKNLSVTISEPSTALSISETHEDVKCKGESNGSIDLSVTGGTSPYKYDWDTDGTGDDDDTEDLTGLSVGTYKVTVTDKNGCSKNLSVTISEPDALQIDDITVKDVTCYKGNDGQIKVTVSGGTASYHFDNGTTTNTDGDFQNLEAGDYTITITDSKGCDIVSSLTTVGQGDSLYVKFTDISQAVCPSSCIDTATATADGGSGDYTYKWETGTNAQTAEDLCKGYNKITVTDNVTSCEIIDSVFVKDSSNLLVTLDTIIKPNCYGEFNGEIQITVDNGTSPYTFDWEGPNSYSKNITGSDGDIDALEAGTYYLTVDDASSGGCSYKGAYTIDQPDTLVGTLNLDQQISCYGNCDGALSLVGTGGTTPYTYAWSSSSNTTDKEINLCVGYTTFTLTDANGCTNIDSLELIQPDEIKIDFNILDTLTCYGDCDARVQALASKGVTPYTYAWSSSANTTDTESNLCAGWVKVTVTDNNGAGCSVVDSVEIEEPVELTLSNIVNSDVDCNGACSGSATVTAAGGTEGTTSKYTFDWPDGQSGVDLTQIDTLCFGFYTVTVTDLATCQATTTFEIEDASNVGIDSVTSTPISCYGICDGTYEVKGTGGDGTYTYKWSNGDNTASTSNLCDSVYFITVTDGNGCQDADTVHLIQPDEIMINFELTQNLCFGDANAQIIAHIENEVGVDSYQWSAGTQVQDSIIINLSEAYYTLTFTDGNSCTKIDSAQIVDPSPVVATIVDSTMNQCSYDCNGDAIVRASGGTGTYSYIWDDNNATTDSSVANLCRGIYKVTVTDINNCSDTTSVRITSPDTLKVNFINVKNVACNGGNDGEATADPEGGTPPYTYKWSVGDTDDKIENLSLGTYKVTVTDSNGCEKIDSVKIEDTSDLQIIIVDSTTISCHGLCEGSYTATGTGGQRPYAFEWYDDSNNLITTNPDSVITGLCAGKYLLKLTDVNHCEETRNFNLVAPDSMIIVFDSTNVDCFGNDNGEIIAHISGGTMPRYKSIDWSPSGGVIYKDTIYKQLTAAWYYITVTDTNSCTKIDSVELIQPNEIILTFSNVSDLSCYQDTGSATVTPSGNGAPYTFLWDNNETDSIATKLLGGLHYVTVTDGNGCQKIDTVRIKEPLELLLDSINISSAHCGMSDGEAMAYVSGGTQAYTYTWSRGTVNDSLVTDLAFGSIDLTVTDANSCEVFGTALITDSTDLEVDIIDSTMIKCAGSATGSAKAEVTGGLNPYTYLWTNGDTTLLADTLIAGVYTITVTDNINCQVVDSVRITEDSVLAVNPIIGNLTCGGTCTGTVYLETTGGVQAYIYDWSEAVPDTSYIENLCDGMYHFTVTDAADCNVIDSVEVTAPNTLVISIDSVQNEFCYGDSNAYAVVSVTGGLSPYTYIWSNADTDSIADSLSVGWVYVTIQDAGACTGVDSVEITQPDSLIINLVSSSNVSCGVCNGTASVNVTGGTPSYNYDWGANADHQTTADATNLCADIYNLVVVDTNSCTASLAVTIEDNSPLDIAIIDSSYVTCYGLCDGTLTTVSSNGDAPYSVSWYSISDFTTPLGNIKNDTVNINALCADTFKITVIDAAGCSESVLFNMTQPDSLSLILNISDVLCYGDTSGSITAIVSGGMPSYNYLWSDNSTDTILEHVSNGNYRITITDNNGCQKTDSVELHSLPQIFSTIVQTDTSLCSYDSDNRLALTVTGGVPNFTYLWSNDSTTQNIDHLVADTYIVTITDNNGCHKIDSATVTPSLVFDFGIRGDTLMCPLDTGQIEAWANKPKWDINFYHWISSDYISDTLVQNPYIYPKESTTFYLTVDSICKDTVSKYIKVHDLIGIDAGPDETILKDQTVALEASSNDSIVEYLWSPAIGLSNDIVYNPTAGPKETILYLLRVKNIYGCYEYDSLTVTVIPELVFPSGFTPNGDGVNDVWVIDYVDKFPNIEIEIFNRWGELLFYSKGYPDEDRWDGTFNGKELPVGTYYFLVKLNDGIHTKPITGPITIVR